MTKKLWEGIVKVQLSLATTHTGQQAMIYSEDRKVEAELPATHVNRFAKGRIKWFMHAYVNRHGHLMLGDEAEWQKW